MQRLSVALVLFVASSASTLLVGSSASAQTVQNIASRGACSTAGVEGIAAQLAEAQRCMNPGAFVRFAPHPGITLSSSRVQPYAQASARDAIHRAAAGRTLTVNSAFRTVAEQYVLHHSGGCGLAAAPGRSNHQSGRAIDVGSYSTVRSALQAQGCAWLGSSDPVHFDCPGRDLRADSIRAFQRLWNVNNPGDTIAEDGIYGSQTGARLGRTPAGGFSRGACEMPSMPPPPSGGRIRGVVYADGDLDNRIRGAAVRLVETGASMSSASDGAWAFDVPAGEYTVEATADGYTTGRHTCTVAGGEVWCSVELTTSAMMSADGTIGGMLYEDDGTGPGTAIAGGQVVITETGMRASSDAAGAWSLTVTAGTYTIVASAAGYASVTRSCTVAAGGNASCSTGLAPEGRATTLQGVVFTDSDVYLRVIGARVRLLETDAETTSREGDGLFSFEVPPGIYTVEVSGAGFTTGMRVCEVGTEVTWCSLGLERSGSGGGLVVEEAGTEHGAMADEQDLEAARRTTVVEGGCSASGGSRHAPWQLLLVGLLVVWRRRLRVS